MTQDKMLEIRGFGGIFPDAITPSGEKCGWCGEEITEGDQGMIVPRINADGTVDQIPHHEECHLRTIIGSIAHIRKECSCYHSGSTDNDPPDMSKREAAKLAVREHQRIMFENANRLSH